MRRARTIRHARTKPQIALQLVQRAKEQDWPFRAVVADSLYGEDRGLRTGLRQMQIPYVLALNPAHAWWHPKEVAGSVREVAHEAGWVSTEQPGRWVQLTRTKRSSSEQVWWAVEIVAGPYGPEKAERAVVATTDPTTLPDLTTWYLVTNLPVPTGSGENGPPFLAASLVEIVRLYGLRTWVEQNYKHVKHALGWSQYQVRSDKAIRRHWQLVCCAFCFCWYYASPSRGSAAQVSSQPPEAEVLLDTESSVEDAGARKKISQRDGKRFQMSWPRALRAVRAWLEPWIMLRRYWRAWSEQPPPGPLQEVFEALAHGQQLFLYCTG